ncbi:TIGR02757 family protein [Deltaproteobacteria bacterium]|nr:TIGR02757 family protein [Deltaproteobacteria bacterium]
MPRRADAGERALGAHLDALLAGVDLEAGVARDPLRFPKRYADPADIEVAAAFSACLAFGRVSLFGPVIERVLAIADAHGGPAAFAQALSGNERLRPLLNGIQYRWLREEDLYRLVQALGAAREARGSLAAFFAPGPGRHTLGQAMLQLRRHLRNDASPALKSCFPDPEAGSACKRWCMFLRWMVRSGAPDLGLWTHLSSSQLVIPLDTHVFRVAGFLGLTTRAAAGWAAAEEITAHLRRFDSEDPVKYDFALAHLGISGQCLGVRDATVCPACALNPVCRAPGG